MYVVIRNMFLSVYLREVIDTYQKTEWLLSLVEIKLLVPAVQWNLENSITRGTIQ